MFEVASVSKSFSGKRVLNDVSFSVNRGEIHGLVGKNGAGKSTLVNIISGVLNNDTGNISFDGKDINRLSVLERQELGIFVVPQHATIIPEFTVAENLFIGIWPKRKWATVDYDLIYMRAQQELKEYGVDLDPKTKAKDLSLVDQRKLNIVRALFSNAKLIILDEPTTSLSVEERNSLFEFINKLSQQGTSFIFISHYLEEILKLSHVITVIRDGQAYTGYKKGNVDERTLSNLIVGEDVELCVRTILLNRENAETVMKCSDITGFGMNGVSFNLLKGEILGIIGFPGSGAREICRALAGLNPIETGEIEVNGDILRNPKHPSEALSQGIVFVSHDRHKEGIVKSLSIRENISLSILKTKLKGSFGVVREQTELKNANEYFTNLNVKASSIQELVGSLSGGNQQKVVISKALSCNPKVLIIDEPTVGIDVKSREEILSTINQLTANELSVLYLTNDYNELLRVADRLIFFSNGKIFREELNKGFTSEDIIRLRDSGKDDVA